MTMGMIIFIVIVAVWLFVGFCGVMNCKANRVNWEMLFFMFFVPFLALIGHICLG